ncbi:MAG TPA: hypothetical protein VHF23_10815, partial [Gaiellaceae bacterium]|nr:hypothetical protein [Gaiellaceae bacterium]
AEEPAEPGATTPTVEEAPASPAGAQSEAAAPDEGATPWATLVALTLGISGAVGLLLGVVLARRGGVSLPAPSIRVPVHGLRLPVRRLRVPAPSLRLPAPSLRLPAPRLAGVRAAGGRIVGSLASGAASTGAALAAVARRRPSQEAAGGEPRSQTDVLAAYTRSAAEPAAPRRPSRGDEGRAGEPPAPPKQRKPARRTRKKVAPSSAPPPKKELPGVAPPRKKRAAKSGLPPGKAVPRENKAPPPAARPPAPAEAPPAPRPAPSRSAATYVEVGWEECQIEYWPSRSASGALSDFYALALRPGGESYVAAVSQPFRWGRNEPPGESGEKADAHAALVELLLGEGWEPAGSAEAWYQQRFRRRLPAPSELPEAGA